MKKKDLIVKVVFSDGNVMLFGNSYKPWWMQFEEYVLLQHRKDNLPDVATVMISDAPWVAWGGLKWCPEDLFQQELNREGCQEKDPDNPNPRKYQDMVFYSESAVSKRVVSTVANIRAGKY